MNIIERMESIVHAMLDSSANLRASGWQSLESHFCPACGYEGRITK